MGGPRRPRSRRGFTRQPESANATTKIQQQDPHEREERMKIVAGDGKKRAKIWAVRGRRAVRDKRAVRERAKQKKTRKKKKKQKKNKCTRKTKRRNKKSKNTMETTVILKMSVFYPVLNLAIWELLPGHPFDLSKCF